jgi:hypothetical protein
MEPTPRSTGAGRGAGQTERQQLTWQTTNGTATELAALASLNRRSHIAPKSYLALGGDLEREPRQIITPRPDPTESVKTYVTSTYPVRGSLVRPTVPATAIV